MPKHCEMCGSEIHGKTHNAQKFCGVCREISRACVTRTPQHDSIDAEYNGLLAQCSAHDDEWDRVRRAFQLGMQWSDLG